MVNNDRLKSAIRWTEDGRSFLVFESYLKNMCLGKENHIFYTKQPKSFVRQLHLYGFRKINKNQFTHQFFQRGQPELLKYIKRSYKPNQSASSSEKSDSSDHNELKESSPGYVMLPPNFALKTNVNFQQTQQVNSLSNQTPTTASTSNDTRSLQLFFANGSVDEFDQFSINNPLTCHEIPASAVGAIVFANNHDELSGVPAPSNWCESSYIDISYNYNEDSILTLYNSDIYPNTTIEDNNITL